MLLIRDEQMEAFRTLSLRRFEDEMVEHVRQFAPKRAALLGDGGVRGLVRTGMARAGQHALTNRGPIRFFIDLMILLGSGFDTDPQYPWVRAILDDEQVDQAERADQLYAALMDYLAEVPGPDHANERLALRRAEAWPDNPSVAQPEPAAEVDFEEGLGGSGGSPEFSLAMRLAEFYPQKCEHAGEAAIEDLALCGMDQARKSLPAVAGAPVLLTLLMLFLGHECFSDPQLPWVEATLEDTQADAAEKARRLWARLKAHVEEAATD